MDFIFNVSTAFCQAFLHGLELSTFAYGIHVPSSFASLLALAKALMLRPPFLTLCPWSKIPADESHSTKFHMTEAKDTENIAIVSLCQSIS